MHTSIIRKCVSIFGHIRKVKTDFFGRSAEVCFPVFVKVDFYGLLLIAYLLFFFLPPPKMAPRIINGILNGKRITEKNRSSAFLLCLYALPIPIIFFPFRYCPLASCMVCITDSLVLSHCSLSSDELVAV